MDGSGLILAVVISLSVFSRASGQRQCPRLQKPWNGEFIGACNRNVGSECIMQCRDPYILVGSRVRTCRSDGTWTGRTTACELDGCANCGGGTSNCANLYDPANGHTSGQCTPGIAGQTCQFQCNAGYSLEGQSLLTCRSDGQWSSNTPVCRRRSAAICEDIVVPNGFVNCVQQGGLAVCRVTCDEGYMIVGSSVVTCSSSGNWNDQVPSCRRSGIDTGNVCSTLIAPDGGRLVGSCTAATSGDTCQLVCLSGYRPTDTRVLICQNSGRWSDSLPRCVRGSGATCPYLNVPANGFTSGFCSQASVGQSCTFTCQSGYFLSGQSTLYCQDGGRWSSSTPTCTRTSANACASLDAPYSGYMVGTCAPGRVGETCVFGCDDGYSLRGQRTLTCQSSGQWSHLTPICERTGEPVDGGTCPVLYPPPNGEFQQCDNRPGGQCVVVCMSGYTRSGSRVRTCLGQGTWSGYAPTCTRTVGYNYKYKVVPLWSLIFG